jgi:hypothetical protein
MDRGAAPGMSNCPAISRLPGEAAQIGRWYPKGENP